MNPLVSIIIPVYNGADYLRIAQAEQYTSHNTGRLDVAGVVRLLVELDFIKEELYA